MKHFVCFLTTLGMTLAGNASAADPKLDSAFKHYYKMIDLLSQDKLEGVEAEANAMREEVKAMEHSNLMARQEWDSIHEALRLFDTTNLFNIRNTLHMVSLSLVDIIKRDATITAWRVRCNDAPSDWVQADNKEPKNPYFGPSGKICGKFLDIKRVGPRPEAEKAPKAAKPGAEKKAKPKAEKPVPAPAKSPAPKAETPAPEKAPAQPEAPKSPNP